MKRAVAVRPAGQWNEAAAVDVVALDSSERHRRRIVLNGARGLAFLLDLPRAAVLRNGDGLVLEDGAMIAVAGKPEPLVEITARSRHDLARLSWHIGNRHTDVQIIGDGLRIRRDHVLEGMIAALGATLTPIEAVFDPEPGAYADGDHTHSHSHAS
jgi:urease accessory protein